MFIDREIDYNSKSFRSIDSVQPRTKSKTDFFLETDKLMLKCYRKWKPEILQTGRMRWGIISSSK